MTIDVSADRAGQLRQAFDRSFAEAPVTTSAPHDDFLAVRMGSDPLAIRVPEIAGLFARLRVMGLPGPVPELRGLVGVRNLMLPVYDLQALLGYPAAGASPWVICRGCCGG